MKQSILGAMFFAIALTGCDEEQVSKITYGEVCHITQTAPPQKEFLLSAHSLKNQIFSQNTAILIGINKAHQAKVEMNIARASLFPSLNLSTLLYSSSGNSSFTASAVEILFPFLIPGKWAKAREAEQLYLAQIEGTRAVQYNTFASVLSMYESHLADRALSRILESEVTDLELIKRWVDRLYQAGLASRSDLDRAEGHLQFSSIALSKIQGLLKSEVAALRHALGLGLDVNLTVEEFELPPSKHESLGIQEIRDLAFKVSPEMKQLQYTRKAAEHGLRSSRFAFIQGAGVQTPNQQGENPSMAFDNVSGGMKFDIGYTQVPVIELSKQRLKEIDLRIAELNFEITERAEYVHSVLNEAVDRFEMAAKAQRLWGSIFERDLLRYQYGNLDLQSLLDTQRQHREAKIEFLRAKTQLNLNRYLMHRLLLVEDFETLPQCE